MKNLGIILSTWVLLFFAVACMKQEKDVFKSAEAEGRKNGTPIVLQEGGKDNIMWGFSCLPPTNFTVVGNVTNPTGVFTRYAWTAPAGGGWTYQVKYYLGVPRVLMSTTVTTATQIDFPITANPDIQIEVRTVCGDGSLTSPLVWETMPGQTGGTGILIADNLDNFTGTSGTKSVGGAIRSYTYSTSQLNLGAYPERLAVVLLTTSQNIIPFYNIISSSVIIGYNFTVPDITGPSYSCSGDPLTADVAVTLPSTMMGHFVAYKKLNTINWQYIKNNGGSVILPNLSEGVSYQLRVLSQYTNPPVTNAPNPCIPVPN